jgi:hypothetical protein
MKAPFQPTASTVQKRTASVRAGMLCLALAWGTAGCTGEISEMPGGPGSNPGGPPNPGMTGGSGGGGGMVMVPGKPNEEPIAVPVGVDPGSKGIHRLNAAEYNATVADVLGTTLRPASSAWLGGESAGYDNMYAVLDINAEQYEKYLIAATAIADDVFAAADLKAKVMICATEDQACTDRIISTSGRRIFRRPLSTEEVGTYAKVYAEAKKQGENHEGSAKQVLRALLASAEFLYRMEFDPDPKSMTKHPVSGYELASRLSYFLWSSAPDDTLLNAAEDKSLLDNSKLLATVDRMMNDAKATRFVENFAGQWLGARKLPDHAANATVYPEWSVPLATSLSKEMFSFFTEFVKNDVPWNDFMKADFNFVDTGIARLYGMPARAMGTGMQRVEIKDDKRYGFAGLGGFLALSALPDRTSPTLRGRWILHSLLCIEPPPPPEGAGTLEGLDTSKNIRVALEAHRKDPSCAACHALFDPYGLSLEQFDGIGRYRTTYKDGSTIDPSTELLPSQTFPNGVKFTGLDGLSDTMTKDPKFGQCLGDNLFMYSLGRTIDPAHHADVTKPATDRPYLDAVQIEWKKGTPSVKRLIQTLVLAETFRYRHALAAN